MEQRGCCERPREKGELKNVMTIIPTVEWRVRRALATWCRRVLNGEVAC